MEKIQMTDDEFCGEYIATKIKDEEKLFTTGLKFGFICAVFVLVLVLSLSLKNPETLLIAMIPFVGSVIAFFDFFDTLSEYRKRNRFLKKVGLNESQATYRYNFIKYKKMYMPIVQRMCRLNIHPVLKQLDLIKSSFRSNSGILAEFVFEKEYTEDEYKQSINQICGLSQKEKEAVVELLFNIAVLEDGIYDDEWNLLMEVIDSLCYSYNWEAWHKSIESIKNKYSVFRRNSVDENVNDKKADESTRRAIPSHLKPYYDILGLEDGATEKEIKQAYHNLALQHHPDLIKNADRVKECEKMMAKINEAYEKIRI